MEKTVGFRGAGKLPGVAFPAAGADASGVLEETVLHFCRRRFFQPAQYALLRGNGQTVFLLQIFSHQTFQEDQSAIAVGEGVENFHSDPLFIHNDPEGTLPHFVPAHSG